MFAVLSALTKYLTRSHWRGQHLVWHMVSQLGSYRDRNSRQLATLHPLPEDRGSSLSLLPAFHSQGDGAAHLRSLPSSVSLS